MRSGHSCLCICRTQHRLRSAAVVRHACANCVPCQAHGITPARGTLTHGAKCPKRACAAQFTSFKVTTRTKNPKYKSCNAGDAIVMRRFSEFHMLFRKLRIENPGTVVPPCPEKAAIQRLRNTAHFIECRRQALEVFINKVCAHRVLKHSDMLRTFLEADETTWHMEMQRMKQSEESGTVLSTVTQLATDIMQSTKNLAKGQSDDREEDPEYLQARPQACALSCVARLASTGRCAMNLADCTSSWRAPPLGNAKCMRSPVRTVHQGQNTRNQPLLLRAVQGVQYASGAPPAGRVRPLRRLCRKAASVRRSARRVWRAGGKHEQVRGEHRGVRVHGPAGGCGRGGDHARGREHACEPVRFYISHLRLGAERVICRSVCIARDQVAVHKASCSGHRSALYPAILFMSARGSCRIFAAPMKEQHLAVKSAKDTQHDRSVALAHKVAAVSDVRAAKARLTALRSSGKPEAVLQVRPRSEHTHV